MRLCIGRIGASSPPRKETATVNRILIATVLLASLVSASYGQAATTPATFDIADVHVSAHSTIPFMQGGVLRGDKYVIRNATMVELISTAYGVDGDKV